MAAETPQPLPEETIASLVELGAVLRPILDRMVSEGKAEIVNGKVTFKNHANDTRTT